MFTFREKMKIGLTALVFTILFQLLYAALTNPSRVGAAADHGNYLERIARAQEELVVQQKAANEELKRIAEQAKNVAVTLEYMKERHR